MQPAPTHDIVTRQHVFVVKDHLERAAQNNIQSTKFHRLIRVHRRRASGVAAAVEIVMLSFLVFLFAFRLLGFFRSFLAFVRFHRMMSRIIIENLPFGVHDDKVGITASANIEVRYRIHAHSF